MNYLGSFKPVIIEEKTVGPLYLISKKHMGPYHKIVPVIEEVEKWAKDNGLDCRLSFGLYLDNPQASEEARLRSKGGCLIDQPISTPLPEGFTSEALPARLYITAQFEGSPGIGPLKVYPKVHKYSEDQRRILEEWVMEVYEVHSQEAMTTTYYFPIQEPTKKE